MPMRLSRSAGTFNIGVSAAVSESLAFVSPDADPGFVQDLGEVLGVETHLTTISGSHVAGSLLAMNSQGAVVTGLAEKGEVALIEGRLRVARLPDCLNAAGNNVLCNDRGALINPDADRKTMAAVADALGVEVVGTELAGVKTVGSVAVATNKGCVVSIDATPDDLQIVKEVLHVDAVATTVNHGSHYLAAGILANTKGAVVGDGTTPIEMGRIEDGLML